MSVQNLIQQTEKLLTEAKESRQEAELATLHWKDQEDRLTAALENLKLTFPDATTAAPAKFKKANKEQPKKSERSVSIPKTDKAFWMGLMTNSPQKNSEILAKAVAGLGIKEDSAEEMALLKQRLASSLQNLVAENAIYSEGERLNRTFQLPKA